MIQLKFEKHYDDGIRSHNCLRFLMTESETPSWERYLVLGDFDDSIPEKLWERIWISANLSFRHFICECQNNLWKKNWTWQQFCPECKKWFLMDRDETEKA